MRPLMLPAPAMCARAKPGPGQRSPGLLAAGSRPQPRMLHGELQVRGPAGAACRAA